MTFSHRPKSSTSGTALAEDTWSRVGVSLPKWQREIVSALVVHYATVAVEHAEDARMQGVPCSVDPDLVDSMQASC